MDNYTFITKVFKELEDDELPIVINGSTGWKAEWPKPSMRRRPGSWYFSCAAHKIQAEPKRSKYLFSTAHCFVLDDVGTKVPIPKVRPSWVIETSKDNYQYGYLIHPFPYAHKYEYAMRALSEAGFTDKGCIDCVHLFRMPGSLHRTGFEAILHEWDSRKRRHFAHWLRDFGVTVPERIPELPTERHGRPVSADTIADDIYWRFLCENGYVIEDMNQSGWAGIVCPWHDAHTPSADGDNKWMESRYKPGTRVWKCFHESCSDRYSHDLHIWVSARMRESLLSARG